MITVCSFGEIGQCNPLASGIFAKKCSSFEATVFLSLTKVKTLLLHRCALQKFRVTDSQNIA